jgi:gluconolactonase
VFDRQGNFWFSDFGKTHTRHSDRSGIYYARPDGSRITEVSYGGTGYNGIGLSPDESTVYAAETHTGRLIAFDLAAPGEVVKGGKGGRWVSSSAHGAFFDSLAVQANGSVCVATIGLGRQGEGGVTTISPDGGAVFTRFPDRMVTNLCFGGADMRDAYLTLSGTGQLIRTRWPEAGLKLNFNG